MNQSHTPPAHDARTSARRSNDGIVAAVLALVGLALWLGVEAWHGVGEAWDGPGYFNVALPVMLLLCVVASLGRRGRPWLWALALVVPQMIALFARGESGPLWLVGVFVFGVIGLLCWSVGALAMLIANRGQ